MDHISSNVLNNSRDNQPDTSTRLYYPTIVSSTYVARIIRRRRYQRHFRYKTLIPNRFIRLPTQISNDPFTNQFFNGSTF
ncbi:uncharacterized protein OCT59_026494 [Rhizophagus irregularis]|uniref:uncharacterized protein n=1 Tax=Rhizophagus irregularis TaxID=588596 RepID=UPI0019E51BE3|nr:hypothetical protein OCT59_026494 [Rhizophagus irregularis]GET50212.1 hypothetical protein GLOIN_2v1835724 [Rhizophagus irregularis DAOM 181602=DAOM 197198]CAB4473623.1 unnamed protein product [Rhizophagus irregularis]